MVFSFRNMCCCFNCCREDKDSQIGESSERTRLLVDPTSNCSSIQRVRNDDTYGDLSDEEVLPTDKQYMKKKIFQSAAADMIDLTSATYQIDMDEYRNRGNAYSRLLASMKVPPIPKKFLLEDVPRIDNDNLVFTDSDYLLITRASKAFHDCVKQIKVQHKAEIVVPFDIP